MIDRSIDLCVFLTTLQDVKVRYFQYMIQYHLHEKDYLAVAKAYWSCFDTPSVRESPEGQEVGTLRSVGHCSWLGLKLSLNEAEAASPCSEI